MFDLKNLSEDKPSSYTYTVKGLSKTAMKVLRSDRAKPQTFMLKTYFSLLKEGRLTVLSSTTFQVENDTDFNPESQFDELDLG